MSCQIIRGDDEMRQAKWFFLIFLVLALSFTGCGQMDEGDVVKDIEKALGSLESYKAVGTMKIMSENSPQVYSVEVWYKQPHYYRIALNNVNSQVTQIVLRNDDGVFVLDPALNKSYRFQSDWPENNGAVYLFQSLADSIIKDSERIFSSEEDLYLFEVKANYQNQTLSKQRVWFDEDVHPVKVEVYDPNETQLVEMIYTEFEFNASFDEDAFDMERNLTGWSLDSLPVMENADESESFGVIEPSYLPNGVVKSTPKFVEQEDGKAVVIKYSGEYNFTLVETMPKAISASAPELSKTEIVDLGYGIGVLTELTETKRLSWIYDGVEFQLTGDMPTDEMVQIAKSVFGQSGK